MKEGPKAKEIWLIVGCSNSYNTSSHSAVVQRQETKSQETLRSPREFRCTQRRPVDQEPQSFSETVKRLYNTSYQNIVLCREGRFPAGTGSPREFRCTQRRPPCREILS